MNIEQAKQFINDKLNEAKERKEVWESLLTSAKQAKETAAEEISKTYEAADPAKYHAAQDSFRTASDAISMYSDKIAGLDKEPLISAEEYKSLHDDIVSTLDELNEDAKKRICTIIDQEIKPIADDIAGAIADANDLLVSLQIDLLKDHRAEEIPSLQSKYTDHSIIGFLNMITASNLYKEEKTDELS